ncbi:MAG: response regulator [Leptospiraceae bacterium]|nr:response regulator [Leptospiraceae bacterium]
MQNRILIIDDDENSRTSLEFLLLPEKYSLETAPNAKEGFRKTLEWIPDVIICDIMMPEVNGLEFCKMVRSNPLVAQIPIILLTSLSDRNSKLLGLESGADDFLSKPVDSGELKARLRTTLKLNRFQEIDRSRKQLKWILENSEDGFLILDSSQKIVYSNDKASLFMGLKKDEYKERIINFKEIVQKKYSPQPEEAWTTWPVQSEDTKFYLVSPETSVSNSFWLEVKSLPNREERMVENVIQLRDVSPQINANIIWSTLLRSMSHKIRTPVGGVFSSLELLSISLDEDIESFKSYVGTAYESADRLRGVVEDIFSYIQAPLIKNSSDKINSEKLFGIITKVGKELQVEPAINFETDGDFNLGFSVESMEMIFNEILENSKKFHPQHSPKLEIRIHSTDAKLSIDIRDNGIHLSPEQLEKVWIPFYQGEKFNTGEVPGVGLGLSTVSLLMWNIGGKYLIKNREGVKGIIVELDFPLTPID